MIEKELFRHGDVVQLKSGGPAMTIVSGPDGIVGRTLCCWFEGMEYRERHFIRAALKRFGGEEDRDAIISR